jgi:hypothetical protein
MLEEKKDKEAETDSEMSFEVDPRDFSKHWQYLKKRENLLLGTAAGAGAAVIAIIIWALAVKFSGYKVGWMAIAASFGIGFAIRYFGKGVSPAFGVIGGGTAFLAWLAGNIITTAFIISSRMKDFGFFKIISHINFATFMASLQLIDWILAIAAAYIAYFFGFKKVGPPQ